jgi:hypothetical protein
MKLILLLALAALFASCSPKYGCGSWRDVQKHDSKPFTK